MELTVRWRFVVGIDVSKHQLDCWLLDRKTGVGQHLQVANAGEGFDQLGRWLSNHGAGRTKTVLVSEHTGRYGEQLLRWTTDARWPHAVVKTTALQQVGQEHHRKEDAYDAEQLADYGHRFADQLPLTQAPRPAVAQIKRLRAERRKMVDRRAALKAKLGEAETHDADMQQLRSMWSQQVELLSQHIQQLEQTIEGLIQQDAALAEKARILRSAPGMGKVLTPFWLSLFAGQPELNPRKIASRFGFAPHSHSSGSSVRAPDRSTGHGNAQMRRLMHQAARSVATHKPHYQDYYQGKLAEGKHELVAINNIINKLIRLYCALWNKQVEYDPNYIENNKHKWKKSA